MRTVRTLGGFSPHLDVGSDAPTQIPDEPDSPRRSSDRAPGKEEGPVLGPALLLTGLDGRLAGAARVLGAPRVRETGESADARSGKGDDDIRPKIGVGEDGVS